LRALVTGGAGFLGSHVVDALRARGDRVVALDDLSTGDRKNLSADTPLRVASVADRAVLEAAVAEETFEVIIHCAAKTKVVESMEKADLYRRVIVDGTRNVVALAENKVRARFIVNISTGGAMYGETPLCATEATPATPDSNYGRFKLEAEAIVAKSRVPSITLRAANLYGPRQRRDLEGGVVAIFVGCWQRGQPITLFGDGSAERDYVYVGDVVDAVLASTTRKWTGVYNIGTGVPTSVNDLIDAMTEVLGPPVGIDRAPARPVETQRSCLDPDKAARDGFWRPATPLAKGLRRTAAAA
jgi:UDP-glucose 4-epimerase